MRFNAGIRPRFVWLWLFSFLPVGATSYAQDFEEFFHPYGFAMTLPQGWSVQAIDEIQYQLLPPDAGESETVLVMALPAGEVRSAVDPQVIAQSERDVLSMYPMLSRVGDPVIVQTNAGTGVISTYEGRPLGGSRIQMSMYLVVMEDIAVSVMAVGLRREIGQRREQIDAMFASTRAGDGQTYADQGWYDDGYAGESSHAGDRGYDLHGADMTPPRDAHAGADALHDGSPAAREWLQVLRGRKLVSLSGYDSGGGSGGFNSRTEVTLYANGQFEYYSASSVSMYVDGMSGGSASEDSERGTWRIVSSGRAVMLEFTTHTARYQDEISRWGNEIYLGGTRVFVTDP
ncbi:MAG: hypothetical protein JJU27_15310 [Gammaproteobacteria bacterium]|nr:hypothetical protein [Gammaproteobacteria bacterium]